MDDVRAATIGYIHRNIEIYIGQPILKAAKTTRGPRVVHALRARNEIITLTARPFASLCEELKGKYLLVDVRRSNVTLLKFPIMLLLLNS